MTHHGGFAAELERQAECLRRLRNTKAEMTSRDGSVTVVASVDGAVLEVRLRPAARQLSLTTLGKTIADVTNEAVQAANRAAMDQLTAMQDRAIRSLEANDPDLADAAATLVSAIGDPPPRPATRSDDDYFESRGARGWLG